MVTSVAQREELRRKAEALYHLLMYVVLSVPEERLEEVAAFIDATSAQFTAFAEQSEQADAARRETT
jgi:hypothetical protein